MDAAGIELADLDGLSVAEMKSLLCDQHAALQEQHEQLLTHREQLVVKDEQIRFYTFEIESLRLQILKLRHMQFGSRSEKRAHDIEQLQLLVENLETAAAERSCEPDQQTATKRAPSVPKPRREFGAHLPRETQTIAPHQSCCPDCGGELKHLGEDVKRDYRNGAGALQGDSPSAAQAGLCKLRYDRAGAGTDAADRTRYGRPGLLAHVVVGKYADHLPLYRQADIYAREGVELDRTLLAQWVGSVSALLAPLTDALRAHVFAADVVHADDTPLPVLAPGLGKTKTGRLWTYVRDERPAAGEVAPAVWFAYSPDRKGEHPQGHLADFSGILQADGYAGFSKIYDAGRVLEAACWAHVRRKFVDLHQLHQSPVAAQALDRIGALYAIEQEIRGRRPHERCVVRQERSRPLLDSMKPWLEQTLGTLSQKSEAAKAIRYALNRWQALGRYCDDGRIEIDNNAAERALRSVAVGRKNFLFAGSDAGGERAAAMYSLLGSAKLNGHNLEAFVREVLTRIADLPITRINELLPWNLQATHANALTGNGATPKLPP